MEQDLTTPESAREVSSRASSSLEAGTSSPTGRPDPIRAGLLGRCPHCAKGRLFDGFLKVRPTCEVCGYDLGRIETGDGPATFIMQIAGGVVVFTALYVYIAYRPPIWVLMAVTLPMVFGLSLGLMRPGKGLMTALHYRSVEGDR